MATTSRSCDDDTATHIADFTGPGARTTAPASPALPPPATLRCTVMIGMPGRTTMTRSALGCPASASCCGGRLSPLPSPLVVSLPFFILSLAVVVSRQEGSAVVVVKLGAPPAGGRGRWCVREGGGGGWRGIIRVLAEAAGVRYQAGPSKPCTANTEC